MELDKRIESLLDKYWLAETSADDEAELREYFKSIDPDGNEVASLFHYFSEEKTVGAHQSLDEGFSLQSYAPRPVRIWRLSLFKTAAALLIILSIVATITIYQSKKRAPQYVDTYRDPQEAMKEVKNSLLLISKKLNKAKQYTIELKQIDRANQLIK